MRNWKKWIGAGAGVFALAILMGFQPARKTAVSTDPLIEGFRKTTVASVADAVDTVVGHPGFMSHDMRPRIAGAPARVVGRARTAFARPAAKGQSTPQNAAKHAVAMIDDAKPGEVGIIVLENGLDIAAIGGLMATTAKARDMAGIIADGAVRDLAEIRALGLPVFSRGIAPSTSVGRYISVSMDEEVTCAGVKVKKGDIIVAGEDGVVVVPSEKAAQVLKTAQEIDDRESKMVPFIKQFKSLTKTIQKFNRI
ncbi:MAG: hypothetical protein IANPNBLG_03635 [Bryobacteraceae bacterium]|nr:hypothetical protein [Bryobacteraceae bacterium]